MEAFREEMGRIIIAGISQRTDDWVKMRRGVVGGSSMDAIIGQSKYCSPRDWVAHQLFGDVPDDRTAMDWGTVFEPILKSHLERRHNAPVLFDNVCMSSPDHPGCIYSPDGFIEIDGRPLLLELKCPFQRFPRGNVPDHYIPQILMGLDFAHSCERALFVDAVFRVCELHMLETNESLDMRTGKIGTTSFETQDIGVFRVLVPASTPAAISERWLDVKCGDVTIDLIGILEPNELRDLFGAIARGDLIAEQMPDPVDAAECEDCTPDEVGRVAWKLIFLREISVQRVDGFIESHRAEIDAARAAVETLSKLAVIDAKKELFLLNDDLTR